MGGSAVDLAGLDTPASNVAYILDLAEGVWTGTSTPMSQARVMGNAILLPTSQVLILNGAGTGISHSKFCEYLNADLIPITIALKAFGLYTCLSVCVRVAGINALESCTTSFELLLCKLQGQQDLVLASAVAMQTALY